MKCKGCGQEKPLVKAHIIPESIYRDLRGNEEHLLLVSNIPGVHNKRSRIGVYDEEMLCRDCENKFQEFDSYAAEKLIQKPDLSPIVDHDGKTIGYKMQDVDNEKLKRFFVSVLWRASISTQPFFKDVNLGPLEDKAKSIIFDGTPHGNHEFSFVLAKFEDTGTVSKAMFDPKPERCHGKNYYRFYMGGYVLNIKSDSQNTPSEFIGFIPSPEENTLTLVARGEIERSKEYSAITNGVRVNSRHSVSKKKSQKD